jgi:hypothetical protein
LVELPDFSKVTTISRREPKTKTEKVNAVIDADSSKWSESIAALSPPPEIFFSGLGTTRADAGGVDKQRLIDLDLNDELAQAAKKAGSKVYVLISSGGADHTARSAYMQMKGELEERVKALGFEHTVILRPGLLVGPRENTRTLEQPLHGFANLLGHLGAKDFWAQDADVVARAAVHAGLKSLKGEAPKDSSVWMVYQKEIIQLGREQWPPSE